MGISGLIAGAVQRGQDERREQQLRELAAKLDEEMRRQDMQLRREQVEISRANMDANRIAQEQASALASLKHRDEQARQAYFRNVGTDAANVLNMPGMTNEQKAEELRKSVARTQAANGPAMMQMIEGLTRVTPEEFGEYIFTDPNTGVQSKRQYKRGSIPSGGLDMGRQPEGRGTGSAPSYLTLVNQDGKQRRVADGAEANALFEQGWTIHDPVAARSGMQWVYDPNGVVNNGKPFEVPVGKAPPNTQVFTGVMSRDAAKDIVSDEKKLAFIKDAKASLAELKATPGQAGATGMPAFNDPGSWQRWLGMDAAAGSPAAVYDAKRRQVISRVVAPRLDILRGLGQMSDREFGNMVAGATSMGEGRLSEKAEQEELTRITDYLDEAEQVLLGRGVSKGITVVTPPPGGGGNSLYQDYLRRRKQGGQ